MKVGVVKLSQAGGCLLPMRFLDNCQGCQHLCPRPTTYMKCMLPEAVNSRVLFWERQIQDLERQQKQEMAEAVKSLQDAVEAKAKLGGERIQNGKVKDQNA